MRWLQQSTEPGPSVPRSKLSVVRESKNDFEYGLTQPQAEAWAEQYTIVRDFLNKYTNRTTRGEINMGLARFFKWLEVVKDNDVTPSEFLNTLIEKRNGKTVEQRRWGLTLALQYSRDNPDLKGKAQSYIYSDFYLPLKMFCDYNEVPLTTVKGFFSDRERRKFPEVPFTPNFIKKVLGALNQRDRAICMVQLQSGQSIHQVLGKPPYTDKCINAQADCIFEQIDLGARRIRFDFDERKGNNFRYFTFISFDAIQELQKWRPIRQKILNCLGIESPFLFITDTGKPMPRKWFHNNMRHRLTQRGIYKGSHSVPSHGFRKFFEQEASPPERGISKAHVIFMMGHSNGEGGGKASRNGSGKLDAVGGVYDKSPMVYPQSVEGEYVKLEPYLNIYSGIYHHDLTKSQKKQAFLDHLAAALEDPEKARKFEEFLGRL